MMDDGADSKKLKPISFYKYIKFGNRQRGRTYIPMVNIDIGRRRFTRKKFKRAGEADAYGRRVVERYNSLANFQNERMSKDEND